MEQKQLLHQFWPQYFLQSRHVPHGIQTYDLKGLGHVGLGHVIHQASEENFQCDNEHKGLIF